MGIFKFIALYSYDIIHDSDSIYDVFNSKAHCMHAGNLILTSLGF